ncbi:MAG TPA: hypothetical protein VKV37_19790 [Ktedonobacteraceae bacterium]|nr:hypothetical protein [Ktedonobacteraceae bacterium]
MREIDLQPASVASSFLRALMALWRRPELTVARFTLKSYVRSGWILGDIVFVWFLYALFFYEFGGNVTYFYGTAGQGLGVLAILDTIVMARRAMSARLYLPLARLSSRSSYLRGLVLATAALRIPLFLLTLLLAAGYHAHIPVLGIQGATVSNMLPGAIGLLLNCMILSTLTVALSTPIATRRIQIIFLAWLAGILYSNTNPGIVAQYLTVLRIPLAPLSASYGFGQGTAIDLYGAAMLLLAAGYIVGLTLLADFWLRRRDLILL